MLLEHGIWLGKGSWRITTDSNTVAFDASILIQELEQGIDIQVDISTVTGTRQQYKIWVAPDETGMYTVSLVGNGLDMDGAAKLESTPHLGLLSSTKENETLAVTLFETREAYGVRGFFRRKQDVFTFELALRTKGEIAVAEKDNVISFQPG